MYMVTIMYCYINKMLRWLVEGLTDLPPISDDRDVQCSYQD